MNYLHRSTFGLILFWNIIPQCKNNQKQKTIFKHKNKNINNHFMLYIEFESLYERVYLYPKYRSHMIYKWLNYIPPQHKIKWIHVHEFFKWSMQEWIFVQFCFFILSFQFPIWVHRSSRNICSCEESNFIFCVSSFHYSIFFKSCCFLS